MKSISLNIRALVFDGQTPPPGDARIVYNSKTDSHELVPLGGNSLGKFGLLRMRDLLAHELLGATDHVYVSWAGHSGQAGVTSFAVRSCHLAFGRQIDTSPRREIDPSVGTARVGPFGLGYTDELVLSSDAKGDQVVTLAMLIGTAVEVERLLNRDQDGQVGDAVALHAATHQDGGSDPLDVSGLSGELADPQKPKSHASSHANGGGDELNVSGLSGELADPQPPKAHALSHQNGAGDQLNVNGLSGVLADAQVPIAHASRHANLGTDPIKLDALAAPDDNANLNASTFAHGLLRKLSGNSSEVLNGAGAWISSAGLDSTAIHDNVAGEIAAVTTKATPGPSDRLLIEDDADTNKKKSVTVGSLRFGEPTTVYELNWSTQTTQLGITNGTVVVDGKNWTAVNAGNASLFRIQNGSGLQISATPGVARDFDFGLDTSSDAPALYCELETLAAECRRYDLPLTIWSYFSLWSAPSASNCVLAGVGGTSSGSYVAITSGAGWLAAVPGGASSGACLKRGATTTVSAAATSTHKVLVWRSMMDGLVDVYSGTWSTSWPTRDALTLVGRDVGGLGSAFSTSLLLRRSGTAAIYAAETRATSGSPAFTLARTRIQIG